MCALSVRDVTKFETVLMHLLVFSVQWVENDIQQIEKENSNSTKTDPIGVEA